MFKANSKKSNDKTCFKTSISNKENEELIAIISKGIETAKKNKMMENKRDK